MANRHLYDSPGGLCAALSRFRAVAKTQRGRGVQHRLLGAGIDYARSQGVGVLEAYPVDKAERSHDDFMFFGSRSLYEAAGFEETVRRSPTRVDHAASARRASNLIAQGRNPLTCRESRVPDPRLTAA